MEITVNPGLLSGRINAISSKSQAHRMLICAALSDKPCRIYCKDTNDDIDATVSCLVALGASIQRTEDSFLVTPISAVPEYALLDCGESGSTLRFLLPVVGALGVRTTFKLHGRLPQRPLSPLWEEMERMGCKLCRSTDGSVLCSGKLKAGAYSIDGSVSSQFITGLMFALSIIVGRSSLTVTGEVQSKPYIDITKDVICRFLQTDGELFSGKFPLCGPEYLAVEGDWSNGAFYIVAAALGNNVEIAELRTDSKQGDKEIASIVVNLQPMQTISAAQIPDLMPILSILAAAKGGAMFTDIQRLRLKESDRVEAVVQMLRAMSVRAEATEETLTVYPGSFAPCTVDSSNDHRIAMSAAIAATVASGPITITNAQCVEKSYPAFWQDFRKLGGKYE